MSTSDPSITLAKGAASATLIGVIAVFLWACLALLTTLTAGIPAFQLLASSFAVAFVASLIAYLAPLFSKLLLIAVGQSDAKPILMIPAVLIITGAVIATSRSRTTSR